MIIILTINIIIMQLQCTAIYNRPTSGLISAYSWALRRALSELMLYPLNMLRPTLERRRHVRQNVTKYLSRGN
jgi:hypothetical protein